MNISKQTLTARSTLLECLQVNEKINRKIITKLSLADWDNVCNLARQQRIIPLLYYRLKKEGLLELVPENIEKLLNSSFKRQTHRNLALQGELCKITQKLNDNLIPVIILKGMYLAPAIYPHLGLRQMRDLDLLVPPERAESASKIMETLGYSFPRNLQKFDLDFSCHQHLPEMKKEGFIVEIHGRICLPDENYSIDPQTWWHNAQKTEIGGGTISVLDPVDLFLHLCIHISYMHLFIRGVRHYYDLVAVLQYYGSDFDWRELLQRSKERNWQKIILIVLIVTKQLFGITLPPEVMETLERGNEKSEIEKISQAAFSVLWTTHTREDRDLPHNLAKLTVKKGWRGKLHYIGQRIFLPPKTMVTKYNLEAGTLKNYLYYFVRIKGLFLKFNQPLLKLVQGDQVSSTTAQQKNMLLEWLERE